MNRQLILCDAVLNKVISQDDTTEIMDRFHEIYSQLGGIKPHSFRRLLMSAAVEHNHTELRMYLMTNARCNYDSDTDSDLLISDRLNNANSPQVLCSSNNEGSSNTLEDSSVSISDPRCREIADRSLSSPHREDMPPDLLTVRTMSSPVSEQISSDSLRDISGCCPVKKENSMGIEEKLKDMEKSRRLSDFAQSDSLIDMSISSPHEARVPQESFFSVDDNLSDSGINVLMSSPLELKSSQLSSTFTQEIEIHSSSRSSAEDIVRLLMSDDGDLNETGIRRLIDASSDTFKGERGARNPLLILLTLAEDCFFYQNTLSLPDIIQLLIERGADVNDYNEYGLTPLNYLMSQVIEMRTDDDSTAVVGNHMIVEIARLLLVAGSHPDGFVVDSGLDGPGLRQTLDHLILVIKIRYVFSADSRDDARGHLYLLTAELVELLLAHGAKPRRWFWIETHQYLFEIPFLFAEIYEWKASISGYTNFCNNILDGLGNIFRCFWMIESASADTNNQSREDQDNLTDSFIDIACYSSPARSSYGRSTKIIHHLLNSMSTTQRSALKRNLSERVKSMTELSPEELSSVLAERIEIVSGIHPHSLHYFTKNALDWVCRVEKSFSLQHLVRRAIISAMGPRCLSCVSTLELPKHLEPYVLHKID